MILLESGLDVLIPYCRCMRLQPLPLVLVATSISICCNLQAIIVDFQLKFEVIVRISRPFAISFWSSAKSSIRTAFRLTSHKEGVIEDCLATKVTSKVGLLD
jgi:hypothetical protein